MTHENNTDSQVIGQKIYSLIEKLYPICRSITGNGVRETIKILQEYIPLEIKEIPTGTKVFDWAVPKEWNIKNAYIKNSNGEKIIDFQKSNLHIVSYSIPLNQKMSLQELQPHLHTLPKHPDWIPYLTSYYKENWGFCLSHNQYTKLTDDIYEVVIDSSLTEGSLTYGELFLPGESSEEILFTCYICHPSLCNDNLSGTAILTFLAQELQQKKRIKSYRFLFLVETIGAITWLALNQDKIQHIKAGIVAVDLGDSEPMTYKKTKTDSTLINQIVEQVLSETNKPYTIREFSPLGSDERQFCSPGINLNIGSLMRSHYDVYPQYHTSADNLSFMDQNALTDSLNIFREITFIIEHNQTFQNSNPHCEPQLGRRGVYSHIGGQKERNIDTKALFWLLNYSDGNHSLLDISCLSKIPFRKINDAAEILLQTGLLYPQIQ